MKFSDVLPLFELGRKFVREADTKFGVEYVCAAKRTTGLWGMSKVERGFSYSYKPTISDLFANDWREVKDV